MKKRTFLKLCSAALTGSLLSPVMMCSPKKERLHNWAGNLQYGTDRVETPKSVAEIQAVVNKTMNVKVLGTRHSFSTIADSNENLLSTQHLNQPVGDKPGEKTVTVEAGMRYGELSQYLHHHSLALHNLASLPHISVAGACATATHGSGVNNGNLATAVSALEFVAADGQVINLSREADADRFNGAVVNLGALGVVSKVTLDVLPTFNIRQDVYQNLPLEQLKRSFDAIMSSGYSVSLFTDWQNNMISQVWIKSKVNDGDAASTPAPEFFGAKLATRNLHPIVELSAENCTDQMGVPGPWHERLPHFKLNFTPSSGNELQAEYFVARKDAVDAILAVEKLRDIIKPNLMITEIRTIAADQFWMSPCYQQDSVAIHFTLKQNWSIVHDLLPKIEDALAPFNARPHWAKLFTIAPKRLQSLYERLPDFKKLLAEFDPGGKFRNTYLDVNLYRT